MAINSISILTTSVFSEEDKHRLNRGFTFKDIHGRRIIVCHGCMSNGKPVPVLKAGDREWNAKSFAKWVETNVRQGNEKIYVACCFGATMKSYFPDWLVVINESNKCLRTTFERVLKNGEVFGTKVNMTLVDC